MLTCIKDRHGQQLCKILCKPHLTGQCGRVRNIANAKTESGKRRRVLQHGSTSRDCAHVSTLPCSTPISRNMLIHRFVFSQRLLCVESSGEDGLFGPAGGSLRLHRSQGFGDDYKHGDTGAGRQHINGLKCAPSPGFVCFLAGRVEIAEAVRL